MEKVRLLHDNWKGHKKGEVLDMEENVARDLVGCGVAEIYTVTMYEEDKQKVAVKEKKIEPIVKSLDEPPVNKMIDAAPKKKSPGRPKGSKNKKKKK